MHSRPRFVGLVASASITFLAISGASAQSLGTTSTTAPSLGSDGSPTAAMTFPDNSSLSVRSTTGHFPLVASTAGQTVNIQLRFAMTTSVIVQALDGGAIPNAQSNLSVAADGTASVQFQSGTSPGLYRVLFNQGGNIAVMRFWVADPQQPNSGPPALQPQ